MLFGFALFYIFLKYKLFLKQKLCNQFLVELKFGKKLALQICLYSPHSLELSVKKKRNMLCSISHVLLCVTPWTAACQAPLSMGFPRKEYWSGLPLFPPGDLSDPGIEFMSLTSLALQADSLPTEPPGKSASVL